MNEQTAVFGFLGTGNMGGALARAVRRTVPGDRILLANRTVEKAEHLAGELGVKVTDNLTLAKQADFLFLGVKPQMMPDLLAEIAPVLAERQPGFVLVTMAAGIPMTRIQEMSGGGYPVIRIMPNTPAAIGEGMILYTCGEGVTEADANLFRSALSGAGRLSPLPEKLLDAGSAVSGSGPAFVDLFLEALADGGVACGLPRAQALELAAQMTVGAARLVLETGRHPGELKDAVCSPAGSTIQGVRALEAGGLRSAVTEAVIATYEKNLTLNP